MMNVFQVTNSVHKTNLKIHQMKDGQVFFRGGHAFVKLAEPFDSRYICSNCNSGILNVHNFACAVHFCPTDYYDVELSDFALDTTRKI